jgi:hypothetical protein
MPSKIRILCFTDTNSGRDVEMILPIRYFAERFLNCEFHHAVSFDLYQIYGKKPDVIFTPNVTGSRLYYRIARAASEQGIPLFSLISEGNFKTDGSYDYWGYNESRRFFQEYVCCWSERTRVFLTEREPAAANKIVLTGNTGCDRYVIYPTMGREEFLMKCNHLGYKKVIGYAGWTFNKLRFPRGIRELLEFYGGDESMLSWVEKQRTVVNGMLAETIRNNADTLFVLKRHPQDVSPEQPHPPVDEMEGLNQYRNVLVLGEEEALHDVIGVSDLWTCFESTTALEAWLMKKPTVFLNPEPNFKRADLVKGSAIARGAAEFQTMIDQWYSTGTISEFNSEKTAQQRQSLITESAGSSDGFNHIRTAWYLSRVIEDLQRRSKPRYRFSFVQLFFHLLTVVGGMMYVRSLYRHMYRLKKHLWVFENYRMTGVEQLYTRYSHFLETFYVKHRIEERFQAGTLFDSILHKSSDPTSDISLHRSLDEL